jgi:hypothetical protein
MQCKGAIFIANRQTEKYKPLKKLQIAKSKFQSLIDAWNLDFGIF